MAAPAWLDTARIASPGLRVASWLVELVAFGVLGVVLGLLVTVAGVWGLGTGIGLTAWLFLVASVPLIIIVAAFAAVWVWEGRTGNRIGNLVMRVRTVNATTGGNPGMGRVLGSRMVLAVPSGLVYGLVTAATQTSGGLGATASWLPGVAQTVVVLVMVGSGAWDARPMRQGWHERASGTTVVRVARVAGTPPVAAAVGMASMPAAAGASLPAAGSPARPPVTPVAAPSAPVAMPSTPVAVHAPPAPVPAVPSGALIADVPGFIGSPSAVEPEPSSAPFGSWSAPVVPVVAPAPARVTAPSAADDDDVEHTQISRRQRRGPRVHRLAFDTGEVVDATGGGLVGRAPQAAPGEGIDHLVAIDDPDRSVSKTHLAFGIDLEGLWVADRESTNGTRVVVDGRPPLAVGSTAVRVPDGATVEFGERSFSVRGR